LKRLIAGLSGVVTVIGPESARARVADWAQAALDRYAERVDQQ
jgi:proteasome accessory factor C